MGEFLRSEQRMASAVYVQQARRWARVVVEAEAKGHGDLDNAIRRVGEAIGCGHSAIWNLVYRSPKRVFADVYLPLFVMYEAARAHQLDRLGLDIDATEALCGPDAPAVRAAKALVGADAD